VKYSAAASAVHVTARPHDSRVQVSVTDHGIGIDPHDLPHVFEPFYRGRRAIDSQARGSGVGLSVVRHVIEAHQGRVSIESRPGAGTTLAIDLPAADPHGSADPAAPSTPA
jgi:signal transduction histidine kinase